MQPRLSYGDSQNIRDELGMKHMPSSQTGGAVAAGADSQRRGTVATRETVVDSRKPVKKKTLMADKSIHKAKDTYVSA